MALSYGLGLKGFDDPGAGFTPFAAALLLLINSFYLLMSCLRKTDKAEPIVEDKKKPNVWRVSLVVLSLFGYALVSEKLGFVITSLLLLILLFRCVGIKWRFVLTTSVLTISATYIVFSYLGVRFPAGLLPLLDLIG